MELPVIGLAGDETEIRAFLERLIPVLTEKGLRVGVFDCLEKGEASRVSGMGERCAAVRGAPASEDTAALLKDLRARMRDKDIILAAGLCRTGLPRIELLARGKAPSCGSDADVVAVLSDAPGRHGEISVAYDDAEAVAARIIAFFGAQDECWYPYARLRSGKEEQRGGVTLSIDGRPLPLLPFVQDIVRQVNFGLISALKDTGFTPDSDICIRICPDEKK